MIAIFPPTAAGNSAAIAALQADVDAKFASFLVALDAGFSSILSAISAINAVSATNNAPVAPAAPTMPIANPITVGPGQYFVEPAFVIPYAVKNQVINVLPGTYVVPFDIPQGLDGWQINGTAYGKVVFNGQGGVGNGHRLAWGKGFIHAQCPGTVHGVVFENCGGADGVGDGEAGLYAENFAAPGNVIADHCFFLSNENGCFVPTETAGENVSLTVQYCDFKNNGQSKDGASHDLYVNGGQGQIAANFVGLIVNGCNFYGNPYGNQIKTRAPVVRISGGYNANTAGGRWIDDPNGGSVIVTGGIYDVPASTPGENVLGYGEEGPSNGLAGFNVSNAQIYVGRYSALAMVAPGGTIVFDPTNTLTWTAAGASIGVANGGALTGLPLTPPIGIAFGTDPVAPASVSGCF